MWHLRNTAGANVTPPGPTPPSYETLDSTAEVTSIIGGTEVVIEYDDGGAFPTFSMASVNGNLRHDTGATVAIGGGTGGYSLNDSDGMDPNTRELVDGDVAVLLQRPEHPDGTPVYEYVTMHLADWGDDGTGGPTHGSVGVSGITTLAVDMPSGGSATYLGGAKGEIGSAGDWLFLADGSSSITADFGAGLVDVTLTGFTVTDYFDDPATAPVDTFTMDDMEINGNSFSGGVLTMTNSGVPVLLLGANPDVLAGGNFFGWDATNSIPDEVGGLILAHDPVTDNLISLGFLADYEFLAD